MVQTHVVNTSRKKRNVLSRSKLLLQVFALRENNKILAKAVAEKALKISELENEGLSFKNIKLESRESIKSLREYVINLESMVKKAVSELAGVVNRFTSILSSTKIEKQNVEYLSNLIANDSPPACTETRGLRGRTVPLRSKSQERKKHRPCARRVHPMNLGKAVCVLEPLREASDAAPETLLRERNASKEHGHAPAPIKSEEAVTNTDVNGEGASDIHSQEFIALSTNLELSDVHPSSGMVGAIKRETSNAKPVPTSESATAADNSVKVIKKPPDALGADCSPRRLRPRKPLNYADMLNFRPPNSGTHSHHSKTISDFEDRESKLGRKNPQENSTGKKSARKCSTPLSAHQVKEESTLDPENIIDADPDFKCVEGLKIKHLQHMISKMHGARGSSTKHYSKRSSSNSSNVRKCSDVISQNDDSLSHDSFKRILHILHVKKGHSRSDSHHEHSEKDHGRQTSTLALPHIGAEGPVSIKHEIISPRK